MTAAIWALFLLPFLTVDARGVAADGKILAAYLPYWTQIPASYMDFTRITHLLYAFASLEPTGTIKLPTDDKKVLPSFAASAHAGNAKAILSIGGWGVHPFSTAFNTASGIATFAASVSDVLDRYGFDGVDVDWEYPGQESAPGNPWLPQDSTNFLKALKALRAALPGKVISAAVPVFTWADANGEGLTNLVEYANVLDFISIMAYDVNEGDDFTGANAPLIQNKNNLGAAKANVRDSIATWVATGFPLSKIVLGTPFYGHAMTPDVPFTASTDVSDIYVKKRVSSDSQTISFDSIYSLTQDATGAWLKRFDTWTQTPWLYNLDTNTLISYDDARSIEVKARYAACLGLKGMMTWEATEDGGALMPALSAFFTQNVGDIGSDCAVEATKVSGSPQPVPTRIGPIPSDLTFRCGINYSGALNGCQNLCMSAADCPTGQDCFSQLPICARNFTIPDGQCADAWVDTYEYLVGVKVSYKGQNWVSLWWLSPTDIPGMAYGWKLVGACGVPTATSSTSTTTSTSKVPSKPSLDPKACSATCKDVRTELTTLPKCANTCMTTRYKELGISSVAKINNGIVKGMQPKWAASSAKILDCVVKFNKAKCTPTQLKQWKTLLGGLTSSLKVIK
ncbi:hypothetical protein HDU81_005899 [Chytriomyces hyalinus]|nr:hypothetical protein HDU81_005899 [Chytriomyces hyalinus]